VIRFTSLTVAGSSKARRLEWPERKLMAGDWIKMRSNLWDDPRVGALVDATNSTEAAIVGALYWLWSTADQHTEDGAMPNLTTRQIDRKTGVPGFAAALIGIGWLADDPQGVVVTKFEEHNGQSAKRRCTDAQRKANGRNVSASDADIPRTGDGQKAPTSGAREEKSKRKRKSSTGAEAPADASPIVVQIALIGDATHDVRQSKVDYWANLFTAVDVLGELRKMAAWADANAAKRKTESGIERFIVGWLSKAQDRGGSSPTTLHVVGGSRRDAMNDAFNAAIRQTPFPGDLHDRKQERPGNDDDITDVVPIVR
jgi:hypothetical protein